MTDDAQTGRFHGPSDLHLHSNRSDGTEAPTEVVAQAYAHGVRTVALTDHDTTAGWEEARAEAVRRGMTFIPGMELSTREGWCSIHMLAYLFDPTAPALVAEMQRIRDDRIGRAERIVRNIARDYPITWEDVLAQTSGDATVGRPHIADALVALGLVADRSAAFAGILHPREGYYEGHYAPDPMRAVRLITRAGGVAVVAHPVPSGRSQVVPVSLLEELIAAGLAGVEIDHRENTSFGRRVLRDLAAGHHLIVTGSSDYHGAGKPNRPGDNTTADAMVRRILERGTGAPATFPAEGAAPLFRARED